MTKKTIKEKVLKKYPDWDKFSNFQYVRVCNVIDLTEQFMIEEIDRKIKFWSRPKPDKLMVLPTVIKDLSTESLFDYGKTIVIDVLENLKKEMLK